MKGAASNEAAPSLRKKEDMKQVLLLLTLLAPLWAHGVGYNLKSAEDVQLLSFHYADGSAMSYCAVKLYSPVDSDIAYQKGRTDRQGNFAFLPTAPGLWLLSIDDGQGHETAAEILMTEEGDALKGKILR